MSSGKGIPPRSGKGIPPRSGIENDEHKEYKEHKFALAVAPGRRGYTTQSVLILTSSFDEDPNERAALLGDSRKLYESLGYRVLNKDYEALYQHEEDNPLKLTAKQEMAISKAKDLTLVISMHGNIHWFMGDLPGDELPGLQRFVASIKALRENYNGVIIDSCYSGVEIHESTQLSGDMQGKNKSPARLLSGLLSETDVYGFLGKTGAGKKGFGTVTYQDVKGNNVAAAYENNCVVFRNGKIIHTPGISGIYQSTGTISLARDHYKGLFAEVTGTPLEEMDAPYMPKLYRAESYTQELIEQRKEKKTNQQNIVE